ncbi:histidine phosphatase family protein [Saccharomonospora piscinae]|uniref:histidine phosphatase family protein n=1 Tax=Saccharomonospora piscinae TaxID=687388 RepID=UPI001105BFE7|nr:histidine phosphatase family protein [Saccharomonospora piscinae]TLW91285.1 histidine phosphatase family protein [Saccharomonospora piscinae]
MGAIYFVRHGQASFGAADYDVLSELGRAQAGHAGRELRRRAVEATHARCGTLSRQRATAELALAEAAPGLAASADVRWNEYDHVDIAAHHGGGAAQNSADPRAYQHALENALAAWIEAGAAGGCAETWPDFLARVRAALAELVAELGKGEQAVVFTSGGVIATLCGDLLGDAAGGLLSLNRVAVNAGVSKVVTGRSGTTLLSFNEHGHFDGAAAGLLTYR